MASDLRSLWPKLSPPQRDALVAMALGWECREACPGGQYRAFAPGEWKGVSKPCSWDRFADLSQLHEQGSTEFATSWNGFGLVWDECRRLGWRVDLSERKYRGAQVFIIARGSHYSEPGMEPPEALALAFCLACEVEVPEEWTKGDGQ